MILALCADQLLARSPGKILITNVCTTRLLEDIAARTSGRVVRVPVGRAAAIDALSAYPADQIALAGEGTGAVMMPQFRFVYDGIATMFTLLEMRADRGTPFSEIIAGYPRYTMRKAEIELARQRIPEMLRVLEGRFADAIPSTLDGLRLDWPDRWLNVRVSQTEALVRVIVEQRGDAPQTLFDEVQEIVRTYA
jgi:phosphomannomutase